ncbi:hypothetical protein J2795_004665, partial [Chryseobacterium bernardetii]|nr:hypothetical protein [Chryseobacterium vietnamense]MDR6443910.1 hypothetical protein [Chryseobacterium bernardetii]
VPEGAAGTSHFRASYDVKQNQYASTLYLLKAIALVFCLVDYIKNTKPTRN